MKDNDYNMFIRFTIKMKEKNISKILSRLIAIFLR